MSHPFEVFGSQDLKDDDGPVIDSFFIETDTPPDLAQATEPVPATPETPPIPTSRVLTGYQVIDANRTEPFLLFASDANRQQLRLQVVSTIAAPTFTDFILWADEKSKLALPADGSTMNQADMGRVHCTSNFTTSGLTLDNHTGPVWVRVNPAITAPVEISYWSTTK